MEKKILYRLTSVPSGCHPLSMTWPLQACKADLSCPQVHTNLSRNNTAKEFKEKKKKPGGTAVISWRSHLPDRQGKTNYVVQNIILESTYKELRSKKDSYSEDKGREAKNRLRKTPHLYRAQISICHPAETPPNAVRNRNMCVLQTIPLSPEVGDGGGVAAVTLCLSQTVSKIPTKKGETELNREIKPNM